MHDNDKPVITVGFSETNKDDNIIKAFAYTPFYRPLLEYSSVHLASSTKELFAALRNLLGVGAKTKEDITPIVAPNTQVIKDIEDAVHSTEC